MSGAPVIPAVLVIGALTVHILGVKIVSKPKDCSDNLEECIAEHNLCKREDNALESMCGIEGGPCQLEDPAICNVTIQFMLSGISIRRGCFCQWEEEPCTLLNLLSASCQQHRDDVNSSAKTRWSSQELIPKSGPAPVRCTRALQGCQENHDCASAYKTMRALCHMDGSNCKSRAASSLCLSLWEKLRRSQLGQCTCNRGRRKCLALWRFIHENPCIHNVAESQLLIMTTTLEQNDQRSEQKTVPKMKWPDSDLSGYVPGMSYSCSGQMNVCLELEACNTRMVPLVKACSSPCNQSQCGQRIQQFYKVMPQTMAEKLVFCTCNPEDQECQVAKANLHGGTCEDTEEEWTCLEMLDNCVESPMCRQRFGTLLSKCLGIEPVGPDADSYSEWVNLIDSQLSWSQDRECRMALVASMGTMLQQPCSCDGLPIYELHKCNTLHQLLHNKSIFITHLAITGAPDQLSEANDWISAQWWWSDHLYKVVYSLLVVTILGVVIFVLHKLGRQRAVADQLRYGTPSQKNSGSDANRCQY